ncbi:nuclear prelamin a recognition factor-like, partial [Moniliophthora roreri]
MNISTRPWHSNRHLHTSSSFDTRAVIFHSRRRLMLRPLPLYARLHPLSTISRTRRGLMIIRLSDLGPSPIGNILTRLTVNRRPLLISLLTRVKARGADSHPETRAEEPGIEVYDSWTKRHESSLGIILSSELAAFAVPVTPKDSLHRMPVAYHSGIIWWVAESRGIPLTPCGTMGLDYGVGQRDEEH